MILNSSQYLYGATIAVRGSLVASASFSGTFRGAARSERALVARCAFSANFAPSAALSEFEPDPILNEIGASAFINQNYAVRLLRNGVEIPFKGATATAPKNAIGKTLEVELSSPDESVLTGDPIFKLEIGTRTAGTDTIVWQTVIDSAGWIGMSFNSVRLKDSLSLSLVETPGDKLNLAPRRNRIYYNPAKTTVSADATEILYDSAGNRITTTITAKNVLSLYDAFRYAFVNGCGFDSFETNIPNFEITRVDLPITSTYQEALSGFLGVFEPEFFVIDNVLWIFSKLRPVPEDFDPVPVTALNSPNFSKSIPAAQPVDSFVLEYNQSGNFNAYNQRLEYETRSSGIYGETNYTRTEITEEYFDYYNLANPTQIIKTELKSVVSETIDYLGNVIATESEIYSFDSTGKQTAKTKEIYALAPNLNDDGNLLLQKMREESQTYAYAGDRFNPKASFMAARETRLNGLIAIDSDNQYFSAPFRQEYLEAHRAGNLTAGMTSEFGSVKTITETFSQANRNQTLVKRVVIDHLRNLPVENTSETANGNNSILANVPTAKKMVVRRTGVEFSLPNGNRNVPFAVGELPLVFALPLAQNKLDNLRTLRQGSVEIAGFDSSVERGTFFKVLDRAGDSYGTFVAEGYQVKIENIGTPAGRIRTIIEAMEVLSE